MRTPVFTRLLPFVFLLLVLSCGTRSRMLNMWVDPDFPPGPMTKVLVLALWENRAARETWERAFVHALEKNDVVAVPSHHLLPAAMPDSVTVFDAARRAGCDGVIAIYETYEHTKTVYVPGYVVREVQVISGRGYEVFAHRAYERVRYTETYVPSHERIQTAVRCDVEVWSAPDDVRMVWSGTTEVIEPDSDWSTCTVVAGWVEYQLIFCGLVPTDL
ncbi:MAG TPA: hypothetical protein VEC56_08855 [Candidatus Krumholzibacteria bacterium]|nr:hypothetical protein [Candidatus Krumholzibacteria bacterium]